MRTIPYNPNYNVPPGWYIEELLETLDWKQADLARRCDLTPKTISKIINGEAPVTASTSLQFERVFGVSAHIFNNMEANYSLRKAEEAETVELQKKVALVKEFPVKDLVKRGLIEKPQSDEDIVQSILEFFGFGSLESLNSYFQKGVVHCRESKKQTSCTHSIMAWLQIGKNKAQKIECKDYDEDSFKKSIHEIRKLSRESAEIFYPKVQEICRNCGVVFLCEPPLGKNKLCGAAHWVSKNKAVIQLTLRYKWNDIFWFTFFHEAAHIIKHRNKGTFIDLDLSQKTDIENEADEFAANILIPKHEWLAFSEKMNFSEYSIRKYAKQLEINPGIVVGRLQHEGLVSYKNKLTGLKTRFQFSIKP